jgi:hypothetical protein
VYRWYSSIKAYASERVAKQNGGRARPLTITEGLVAGAVAAGLGWQFSLHFTLFCGGSKHGSIDETASVVHVNQSDTRE